MTCQLSMISVLDLGKSTVRTNGRPFGLRVRDLMGEEAEALLRHRFEIVTTPLTRLKTATIVAIPEQQQVTADEDRGRLVRRP